MAEEIALSRMVPSCAIMPPHTVIRSQQMLRHAFHARGMPQHSLDVDHDKRPIRADIQIRP
jgi:hypothetical protein